MGRGAAPGLGLTGAAGKEPVTIDVDSTIREASGKTKQGAAYGHTNQLSITLCRPGPGAGEVVAARLRNGASKKKATPVSSSRP